MTIAVLLRSRMMGNYQVRFWRAVEGATPSLTLIILKKALSTVGQTGSLKLGEIEPLLVLEQSCTRKFDL
ncbi:hypothetical protein L8106_23775 [Lyngbya sp. PCC 8106]|nr:hypothetical protein L8106_23775 [Lyngbya sp. PCC 8106]